MSTPIWIMEFPLNFPFKTRFMLPTWNGDSTTIISQPEPKNNVCNLTSSPKFQKHVGQWPHHSSDFEHSFLSLNCFRLKGIKKNTWHRKMVFFFFTFLSIMHAFSHNQSYEQIDMNYEENSLITYIELTDWKRKTDQSALILNSKHS